MAAGAGVKWWMWWMMVDVLQLPSQNFISLPIAHRHIRFRSGDRKHIHQIHHALHTARREVRLVSVCMVPGSKDSQSKNER